MQNSQPGPAERLARFLTGRYRAVLLTFLIATAGMAVFVPRFSIDASAETLLVEGNALYALAQKTQQQFEPEEFVLVAYKPHEGSIYSADALQDLRELSERFMEVERVERVNSLLNVPLVTTSTTLGPDFDPQSLTLESAGYEEAELRRIFEDHPLFTDLLVNREQTATALQVVFREPVGLSPSEARRLRSIEVDALYDAVENFSDRADILLGGTHVLANHLIDIIRNDLALFGAGIAVFITCLLWLLFRDWRWVLLPLLCCACSVVLTMGLFGLLGWKTTVISANFIALQLILTLALVIHLIVHYQALARDAGGVEHGELLVRTLQEKFKPCLFAGLTTSVGFGSLLFSGIQPVISFGWMMIVAMASSMAVSLALFPGCLMLCRKPLPWRHSRVAKHVVALAQRLVQARPGFILFASAAFAAFGIAGLGRLELENSFLNYFADDTRARQELLFIDQELGGSTPLDLVYTPAQAPPDGLQFTADALQLLQRVQVGLQGSPAVGKVMSLVNFTELAKSINGEQPLTEYELNSLYTLLDAGLREELLGSYFDPDTGALRISVRIQDSTEGLNRADFLASLKQALGELEAGQGEFVVTNLFVLYQDILQRLYESQVLTLALVYAVLGLVLMLLFRSISVGLIALLPNVLVTLFVLGVMGWSGIPLDLMTITIAAVAMGIAVDDTIHFVHQFLSGTDSLPARALDASYRKVGLAMLYTTSVVALGFAILGFSDFVPAVFFGLFTALAMLVALLVDQTLLPVLLLRYTQAGQKLTRSRKNCGSSE